MGRLIYVNQLNFPLGHNFGALNYQGFDVLVFRIGVRLNTLTPFSSTFPVYTAQS